MKDYYKILGIPYNASQDEIKRAYRKLVAKYHPDINPEENATEKFLLIKEAYETLTNKQLKAIYDVKLHRNKLLKELRKVKIKQQQIELQRRIKAYKQYQKKIEEENLTAHIKALRLTSIFVVSLILIIILLRNLHNYIPISPEKELDLSYRNLSKLPPGIKNSNKIVKLSLDNNKFQEVPKEIATLSNLKYLDMSHNEIKEFPVFLLNMPSLIYIDMSNNLISYIPIDSIKHIKKGITIDLRENPINNYYKERLKEIQYIRILI